MFAIVKEKLTFSLPNNPWYGIEENTLVEVEPKGAAFRVTCGNNHGVILRECEVQLVDWFKNQVGMRYEVRKSLPNGEFLFDCVDKRLSNGGHAEAPLSEHDVRVFLNERIFYAIKENR